MANSYDYVKICDKAHRDGEFVLGWRVLASVGFNEAFKLEPVLAFAAVGRVRESVHFKRLDDGT
jgi:hypothetical protein